MSRLDRGLDNLVWKGDHADFKKQYWGSWTPVGPDQTRYNIYTATHVEKEPGESEVWYFQTIVQGSPLEATIGSVYAVNWNRPGLFRIGPRETPLIAARTETGYRYFDPRLPDTPLPVYRGGFYLRMQKVVLTLWDKTLLDQLSKTTRKP